MKLLVVGAAGKTGQHLVQKALAQGHEVTALVRSEYPEDGLERLRIVKGDARSEADLMRAMQGQDAVVSALGSEKAADELIKRFTQSLIGAARVTGVRRVVVLSTFLLTPNYKRNWIVKLVGAMRKGVDEDKTSGEDMLRSSSLEWTIVYATRLDTVKPKGEVRIVKDEENVGLKDGIARADVADFMLKTLQDRASLRQSILITGK